MPELAQIVTAWPIGVSLAAAVAVQSVYAGRRRSVLNEALHELRRPLQALALAIPVAGSQGSTTIEGSVQLAATALERLEREINGEAVMTVSAPLPALPLLEAAVGRWRRRAELAGSSLTLRWRAGRAMVEGDRRRLAQALDNLIVNAIEHGGSQIAVEASACGGRLRLAVVDSGRGGVPSARRESVAASLARLSGRRIRGHGLRVVRRTAGAHGGKFLLRSFERGTEATLELPLLGGGG